MKRHLSEDEIAAWVAGERPAAQATHTAGCAECQERVGALESAVSQFGQTVREWSLASERMPAFIPRQRSWWQPSAQWLLVTAGIALMGAIPVYENYLRQRAAHQMELDAAADAALLRQVDAGVSRAVPGPLEPLVSLVSWKP
jgi:hypothetical protein